MCDGIFMIKYAFSTHRRFLPFVSVTLAKSSQDLFISLIFLSINIYIFLPITFPYIRNALIHTIVHFKLSIHRLVGQTLTKELYGYAFIFDLYSRVQRKWSDIDNSEWTDFTANTYRWNQSQPAHRGVPCGGIKDIKAKVSKKFSRVRPADDEHPGQVVPSWAHAVAPSKGWKSMECIRVPSLPRQSTP